MSMIDMIENAAGAGALQQVANRVGLPPDQLEAVVGSLAPTIFAKLRSQPVQTGTAVPSPGTDEAEEHGNSILASIFGSKEVSRTVAQQTSDETGVGAGKIKKVLPQLASIAAAAMSAGKLDPSAAGLGELLG